MDVIEEIKRLRKINRWLTVAVILLIIIQLYDLIIKILT
jgi:hypothetical protein